MKITLEDRQNIFDLFNDAVCKHSHEAELQCAVGIITKKQLKAKMAHAKYLAQLSHKVLKLLP